MRCHCCSWELALPDGGCSCAPSKMHKWWPSAEWLWPACWSNHIFCHLHIDTVIHPTQSVRCRRYWCHLVLIDPRRGLAISFRSWPLQGKGNVFFSTSWRGHLLTYLNKSAVHEFEWRLVILCLGQKLYSWNARNTKLIMCSWFGDMPCTKRTLLYRFINPRTTVHVYNLKLGKMLDCNVSSGICDDHAGCLGKIRSKKERLHTNT